MKQNKHGTQLFTDLNLPQQLHSMRIEFNIFLYFDCLDIFFFEINFCLLANDSIVPILYIICDVVSWKISCLPISFVFFLSVFNSIHSNWCTFRLLQFAPHYSISLVCMPSPWLCLHTFLK